MVIYPHIYLLTSLELHKTHQGNQTRLVFAMAMLGLATEVMRNGRYEPQNLMPVQGSHGEFLKKWGILPEYPLVMVSN